MKYCGKCGAQNNDNANYCEQCGAMLRSIEPENVNDINNNVGESQDDVVFTETTQTETNQETQTGAQAETQSEVTFTETETKTGEISVLSIVAFIFAFLIPVVGLVLSIIDLCINDGRKKGLSIAALVISSCFTIMVVVAIVFPISFLLGIM